MQRFCSDHSEGFFTIDETNGQPKLRSNSLRPQKAFVAYRATKRFSAPAVFKMDFVSIEETNGLPNSKSKIQNSKSTPFNESKI